MSEQTGDVDPLEQVRDRAIAYERADDGNPKAKETARAAMVAAAKHAKVEGYSVADIATAAATEPGEVETWF